MAESGTALQHAVGIRTGIGARGCVSYTPSNRNNAIPYRYELLNIRPPKIPVCRPEQGMRNRSSFSGLDTARKLLRIGIGMCWKRREGDSFGEIRERDVKSGDFNWQLFLESWQGLRLQSSHIHSSRNIKVRSRAREDIRWFVSTHGTREPTPSSTYYTGFATFRDSTTSPGRARLPRPLAPAPSYDSRRPSKQYGRLPTHRS